MKTANKLMDLDNFAGDAALYELGVPIKGHKHVVVSAVRLPNRSETFIFPANERGVVIDWFPLPGSIIDVYDHRMALEDAGYILLDA